MDITALIQFDENLFLIINNLPHPEIFNLFFLFFSFYPLIIWLLIGVVVVVIEERKDKLFIIRLVVALCLAGVLASGFIKPIVRRPRPDLTHPEEVVIVSEKPAAIPWNNDFAFPSGHAAIAFAGAYIVTREETKSTHSKVHSQKKRRIMRLMFIAIALMTAVSRIYLGKHYPLDIIAGGFIGWGMGWFSWRLIDYLSFVRENF